MVKDARSWQWRSPSWKGYTGGVGDDITVVLYGGRERAVGCDVICWAVQFDGTERSGLPACNVDQEKPW